MTKIKFITFSIVVIVILGLGIIGYFKSIPEAGNQSGPRPKIEITPKDFDFGEVKYGEVLNHSFKVKNLGESVLEIKRVATSCSCTTAKITLEKIESGQETELLVVYNTGAMSGSHGKGEQERIIYVKSNDPINPQVTAMIYAIVR